MSPHPSLSALLIDGAPVAIVASDLDRTVTVWNAAAERLFGWSAAEAVGGRSPLAGDAGTADLLRERMLAGEAVVAQEVELPHKDGSTVRAELTGARIHDDAGKVVGLIGFFADLAERQRAEESEAQFQLLAQNAVDLVMRTGPDGRFLWVSPSCRRLLGYGPEELIGTASEELLHPDDVGALPAYRATVYGDTTAEQTLECRMRRKDGSYVWVEVVGSPIVDPRTGEVVEAHAAARDITVRKLAEEAEREQRELAESLAAASRALARSLDLETVLETTLDMLERLVPFDTANVMLMDAAGAPVLRATRGHAQWTSDEDLRRALGAKGSVLGVLAKGRSILVTDTSRAKGWVRSPNANPVASWIGIPLVTGGGTVGAYSIGKNEAGFFTPDHLKRAEMLAPHAALAIENARLHVELLRETAELEARVLERTEAAVAARAQAERANEAKSVFLSRVSHDLRTPLHAILGFGQLLELEGLADEQLESVAQILAGGRHLLELIDELIDISRIDAAELDLVVRDVELAPTIEAAVAMVRPIANERGIRVAGLRARRTPSVVLADRHRTLQILLNLVGNAVKYTPPGGRVQIHCRRRGPRYRVTVRDDGPGIRVPDRAKLFEPFERLATSAGTEGTGLGLALVRRMAEAMGGAAGYDPAPGRGSDFWFELPASARSAKP